MNIARRRNLTPHQLLLSCACVGVAVTGGCGSTAPADNHAAEPERHAEHAGHMAHAPGKAMHHGHRFEDAERWAERFEDPGRDEWQRPDQVIEFLALEPDQRAADIGAATGYFPVRLARALPSGRVWGVDIEPDMVRYLNARARREGLDNLFAVLGRPDDPLLPEPVDLILVVNTYHHIEERTAYFRRLRDSLRDGGRVAIVDFRRGDLPVGPPDAMKLEPDQVASELEAAGYERVETELEMLPYQYVLVFRVATTATS